MNWYEAVFRAPNAPPPRAPAAEDGPSPSDHEDLSDEDTPYDDANAIDPGNGATADLQTDTSADSNYPTEDPPSCLFWCTIDDDRGYVEAILDPFQGPTNRMPAPYPPESGDANNAQEII